MMRKPTVLFLVIVSLFTTSLFAAPSENRDSYIKYLLLKKKASELNLANLKTKNFIPQDVIWIDNVGAKMVPRPNPFRKVFRPSDPDANLRGTVRLPNIDQGVELKQLDFVQDELKRLGYNQHKKKKTSSVQ